MALEISKSPELLTTEVLGDLKNEVKKENLKNVWLILDELNVSNKDVFKQKEIMKSLLWKAKEFTDVYTKRLGKAMSGKSEGPEKLALDEYRNKRNLDKDESMKKEFADMTSIDKANVLFGVFGEGLIVRLAQEKVDLATISDEDFDKLYKDIWKKMLDGYVKIKESLNTTNYPETK